MQCPEAESSCNCEVTKKNLRERVNCGGVIKNASKGSNLESCHSQIVQGEHPGDQKIKVIIKGELIKRSSINNSIIIEKEELL